MGVTVGDGVKLTIDPSSLMVNELEASAGMLVGIEVSVLKGIGIVVGDGVEIGVCDGVGVGVRVGVGVGVALTQYPPPLL